MPGIENNALHSVVNTFQADFDCTKGRNLKFVNGPHKGQKNSDGGMTTIYLDTSSCQATTTYEEIDFPSYDSTAFGVASVVHCIDLPPNTENRRFMIGVGRLVTDNTVRPDYTEVTTEFIPKTTNVLVSQPAYTVQKAELTVFETGIIDRDGFSLGNPTSGSTFDSVSALDLL